MKKKRRKKARNRAIAQKAFVRGFVATGLLAIADGTEKPMTRATASRAIKAGIAVAGGTLVAEGLQRRDYRLTMLALTGSAVCMKAAEHIFETSTQERNLNVQEEIA